MLGAANIAFLLRDDRNFNKSASPVKFAEYIASGLAVMGSPNTGDVSNSIEKNKLGILVSPKDLDRKYGELLEFIKSYTGKKHSCSARARQLAIDNYDWQSHRDELIKIYGVPKSLDGEG